MGIPEKSAFVVLAIVVTSVITCALFVCREVPNLKETLDPATQLGPVLPAVVPALILDEDDAATTQLAAPARGDATEVPASQRWYRRRGLAPRWMMRTRETQLEHARGAHVRRDDREPELKVDLLSDTLQRREPPPREPNEDDEPDVR